MLHTALLMLCIGIFAGVMGAILGIGGGMIITPIVTLALGMDIKYAIGASIIAVIATSSGSTIAFLRDDVLNLRVAMFLEIFTTIGAIIGALLTGVFNPMILYVLFGALLVFSSWNMYRKLRRGQEVLKRVEPDKLAEKFKLNSSYYDKPPQTNRLSGRKHSGRRCHHVWRRPCLRNARNRFRCFQSHGNDGAMKMPLKPSSATSNLMMGVTAAASATVYFFNGSIKPEIAVPLALGIIGGASVGSRIMQLLPSKIIRGIFIPILLYLGLQMILKGFGVTI